MARLLRIAGWDFRIRLFETAHLMFISMLRSPGYHALYIWRLGFILDQHDYTPRPCLECGGFWDLDVHYSDSCKEAK